MTMMKEAYDDFKRYKRDNEANSSRYECYVKGKAKKLKSSQLKPGNLVIVNTK
jgi:phospholipid-translocating ATPase